LIIFPERGCISKVGCPALGLAGQSAAERAVSSFSLESEDVGGSQSDNWNNLVANQAVPGAMD